MRGPRPWWFRAGAWLGTLVVVIGAVLLAVRSGSIAATTHTYATEPVAAPAGALAGSLTEVASYDGQAALIGGVTVMFSATGADGLAVEDSAAVWSYHRADRSTCAHTADGGRVLLFYANGELCNEVISLDAASGKRQWQRTIEASGPNQITIGDGSFISVDAGKVIAYEQNQGYERFTLTPQIDAEVAQATCEYLAAAGSSTIPVLQRCQSSAGEPWTYQVIVNKAADGKPQEVGRSDVPLPDPKLVGAMPDGTALITGEPVMYAVPVGGAPVALDEVTLSGSVRVETSIAGAAISSGGIGYVLGSDARMVTWSGPVLSGVRMHRMQAVLLDQQGLLGIDPRNGGLTMRATLSPAVTTPAADLAISGPYLAVIGDGRTAIYR